MKNKLTDLWRLEHMNKRISILSLVLGFLLLSYTSSPLQARITDDQNVQSFQKPMQVDNPVETVLDINNMTIWVQNNGYFHWSDPFSGVNGTFPKGSPAGIVFAQGTLWGGIVNDGNDPKVRVNGSTYNNGMQPGKILPIDGGTPTGADNPEDYHAWRVRRDYETADLSQDASQFFGKPLAEVTSDDVEDLRAQYERDWNNWPAELGAPYEDVNDNGTYEPDTDIPGYPGADQTIWFVSNDLPEGVSENSYGSPEIGMEVQTTIWGYSFPPSSPLGNMNFMRSRLIYRGDPGAPNLQNATIDSMYLVHWVDPDVGTYDNDFAGSDTTLDLGYAYTGVANDPTYADQLGLPSPAVGFDFLQGPVNQEGDTLGMTSFTYFAAGSQVEDPDLTEYVGTLQWYNLMRGFKPRPAYPNEPPFVNPVTNEETKYVLTGDPITGTGWIDGMNLPPGDRRIVLTSGPFTMARGDTQDVVVAQVAGFGQDNLSSIQVMKYYDQFAQFAYDENFELPSPPTSPQVKATALDKKVVLNWGKNEQNVQRTEDPVKQGFRFEGYNVYQLPSATASLSEGRKIATYDKDNLVSVILDNVIDQETGFVVEKPVQKGTNSGVQRYHVENRDAIRSRPLANGVTYYYAVTAYSYLPPEMQEGSPFKQLESTPSVVSVTPQPEKPGVEKPPEPESPIEMTHDGTSTSNVRAKVADPANLTDAEYTIEFKYYDPYEDELQDTLATGDTLREPLPEIFEVTDWSKPPADHKLKVGDEFPLRWNLEMNGNYIGPSDWYPQLDVNNPVKIAPQVNGMQVIVPFEATGIASWDYSGPRWVSGTNFALPQFFGGMGLAHSVFGSNLPRSQLQDVVLEFQGDTTSGPADGWASQGAVYHRADGYGYAGVGYLPLAAYVIESDGSRRQVNVSFVESAEVGNENMRWDMGVQDTTGDGQPDAFGALGGREYLFIHNTDYDPQMYGEGGFAQDAMYFIGPSVRGTYAAHPYLEGAFSMSIKAAISTSTEDTWSFSTAKVDSGITDSLKASVSDIGVFPNPYYGRHKLESGRFDKYVTFTHLPQEATIRIFNLGGVMVRKIDHNSSSQFQEWDLTNQDGLPVGSGIYIAHIKTDEGSKTLKLAIVQEEEILPVY